MCVCALQSKLRNASAHETHGECVEEALHVFNYTRVFLQMCVFALFLFHRSFLSVRVSADLIAFVFPSVYYFFPSRWMSASFAVQRNDVMI